MSVPSPISVPGAEYLGSVTITFDLEGADPLEYVLDPESPSAIIKLETEYYDEEERVMKSLPQNSFKLVGDKGYNGLAWGAVVLEKTSKCPTFKMWIKPKDKPCHLYEDYRAVLHHEDVMRLHKCSASFLISIKRNPELPSGFTTHDDARCFLGFDRMAVDWWYARQVISYDQKRPLDTTVQNGNTESTEEDVKQSREQQNLAFIEMLRPWAHKIHELEAQHKQAKEVMSSHREAALQDTYALRNAYQVTLSSLDESWKNGDINHKTYQKQLAAAKEDHEAAQVRQKARLERLDWDVPARRFKDLKSQLDKAIIGEAEALCDFFKIEKGKPRCA